MCIGSLGIRGLLPGTGCRLSSALVRSSGIWLGGRWSHLGAHRHSYCYSEMVTRYRGPCIPLPKLNQPTQVTPLFLRCEHSACGEVWVSVGLREGGAGCGSGATVLVTWAAKSLVRIGLCLFFTASPGY